MILRKRYVNKRKATMSEQNQSNTINLEPGMMYTQ